MRRTPDIRGWRPKKKRRFAPAWLLAAVPVLCMAGGICSLQDDSVLPVSVPVQEEMHAQPQGLPACIRTELPAGCETYGLELTNQQLMAGRMLLIDKTHPLPQDAAPPNTRGILSGSGGRVACRDLQAVLGEDALHALDEMFLDARYAGHNTMTVMAAARSPLQQRFLQTDCLALLAQKMSLAEALRLTCEAIPDPGCSEHQTAWAVDIRICDGWNTLPREEKLTDSAAGTWLAEHCWQYGFIRRWPEGETAGCRAYHFRYVGRAHAALMQASGLQMEDYLAALAEYGVLTLYSENDAPVCAAICVPAGEHHTMVTVPGGATVEDASADNRGYAIVSVIFDDVSGLDETW